MSPAHICTGAVVDSRTIVTAGHCFEGDDLEDTDSFQVELFVGESKETSPAPILLSFPNKNIKSSVDCGKGVDGAHVKGEFGSDVAVLSSDYDLNLPTAPLDLTKNKSPKQMNGNGGAKVVAYGPSQIWSSGDKGLAKDLVRRSVPVTINSLDPKKSLYTVSGGEGTFCHGDSGGVLMHDGKVIGILAGGITKTRGANGCYKSAHFVDLAGAPSAALKKFVSAPDAPPPPCPDPTTCPPGTHFEAGVGCVEDKPWTPHGQARGCVTKPDGSPLTDVDHCTCWDKTFSDIYGEVSLYCRQAVADLDHYPWYERLSYNVCSCGQILYTPSGGRIAFRPEVSPPGVLAPPFKQFDYGGIVYPDTCFDPLAVCGSQLVPIPNEFREYWGIPLP